MQKGGEAALQQMQEKANNVLTAALAVKVNQLFASFNQKFEASKREETRKADEAIRMMREENAGLRRQMLAMETCAARLEQDREMEVVMEGIMARLGGLPLPEAVAMTPPRGETGSNMTQQRTTVQHPNEGPVQDREPPATSARPIARQCCYLR